MICLLPKVNLEKYQLDTQAQATVTPLVACRDKGLAYLHSYAIHEFSVNILELCQNQIKYRLANQLDMGCSSISNPAGEMISDSSIKWNQLTEPDGYLCDHPDE